MCKLKIPQRRIQNSIKLKAVNYFLKKVVIIITVIIIITIIITFLLLKVFLLLLLLLVLLFPHLLIFWYHYCLFCFFSTHPDLLLSSFSFLFFVFYLFCFVLLLSFSIVFFSFYFWLNNSLSHMKWLRLVSYFVCLFCSLSWNCRVKFHNLITFLQFPEGFHFYLFIAILNFTFFLSFTVFIATHFIISLL